MVCGRVSRRNLTVAPERFVRTIDHSGLQQWKKKWDCKGMASDADDLERAPLAEAIGRMKIEAGAGRPSRASYFLFLCFRPLVRRSNFNRPKFNGEALVASTLRFKPLIVDPALPFSTSAISRSACPQSTLIRNVVAIRLSRPNNSATNARSRRPVRGMDAANS